MDYMRLVRLLYFAERQALSRIGRPITGDMFFALDQGLILSAVLDLCKENRRGKIWEHTIQRSSRWVVALRGDVDLGALTDAEIAILSETSELHKDHDQWELSQISHRDFPEWRDPKGSRIPIWPREIFRAVGKKDEEISDFLEDAQYDANLDKIFNG